MAVHDVGDAPGFADGWTVVEAPQTVVLHHDGDVAGQVRSAAAWTDRDLIIDLREISTVAPADAQALLALQSELADAGRGLMVVGAPPDVMAVIADTD